MDRRERAAGVGAGGARVVPVGAPIGVRIAVTGGRVLLEAEARAVAARLHTCGRKQLVAVQRHVSGNVRVAEGSRERTRRQCGRRSGRQRRRAHQRLSYKYTELRSTTCPPLPDASTAAPRCLQATLESEYSVAP